LKGEFPIDKIHETKKTRFFLQKPFYSQFNLLKEKLIKADFSEAENYFSLVKDNAMFMKQKNKN